MCKVINAAKVMHGTAFHNHVPNVCMDYTEVAARCETDAL